MAKVAFIGLGVMGYPMAGHLVRAGHTVAVYNRTAARAKSWVGEFGGRAYPSPADAARDADIVLACVGRDRDVEDVTRGHGGAFQAMGKGAVFVDHTTASAGIARALAAATATTQRPSR
jgi:3-hydroxyisobutyrate dehydrogenase-like beta-hydroxyacid dehydrogenase